METKIILEERNLYYRSWMAWLVVDGVPVSFMRLMEKDSYEGFICVCTIETRPGYQRKGYAKEILRLAEESLGKKLAFSDGFTPEGFAALCGKIPMLPHYEAPTKPNYESMTFVEDWDKMYGPR